MPSKDEKALIDTEHIVEEDLKVVLEYYQKLLNLVKEIKRAKTPEDYALVRGHVHNLLQEQNRVVNHSERLKLVVHNSFDRLESYVVELSHHFSQPKK
ncbi:MAG: hypothetical protein AABX51_07005 [Nanoarchaeota archaeon]